jgi:hypothetical protein
MDSLRNFQADLSMRLGMNDILPKPFTRDGLIKMLEVR